jgi:hypothetical protein
MEEITLTQKTLVASDTYGPVLKKQTIGAGANLEPGTILGRVTATRKLVPYAAGNIDGSESPVGVLMEYAAAETADVDAVVGFPGAYVKSNMIGLDQAGEDALESRGVCFI